MVPALAAGMRSGSACASAPSTTSTMRCEVSTLPAATARGGRALTIDALGRDHLERLESPSLVGASSGQQQAEGVEHRRERHRVDRVERAVRLVVAVGEVDDRAIAVDGERARGWPTSLRPAPSSSSESAKA